MNRLRGHPARRGDPAGDVGGRVCQLERRQFAPQRDPLLQLAKLRLLQPLGQLRLASQHQGKELFLWRFDVGEQPHFFEQRRAQALCFVHHKRGDLAARTAIAELCLKALEQHGLCDFGLGTQLEAASENRHEVGRRQRRVVEVHAVHVAAAIRLERRADERGLARPRFANQQRQRLRRHQPVLQGAQRLPLPGRQEQVAGIGGELERQLA